jgi:UDP-N-acetylmuramate dehydrogenase
VVLSAQSQPPDLVVREDVPLAPLTTLQVGGAARHFCVATTESAVAAALDWAEARGVPTWILGGGSNVVVSDSGLPGLVVRIELRGISHAPADGRTLVTAAAGEPWDEFVGGCVARGLAGLECLSGIPGRVGATPVQNVGAYGQEVAETIAAIRVLDRRERRVRVLAPEACRFTYRNSLFKSAEPDRFVVLAVTFGLVPSGAPALRYGDLRRRFEGRPAPSLAEVRRAVLAIRREKSMVLDPDDANRRSCGSFFMNPVVDTARADRIAALAGEPQMPRFAQGEGRVKLSAGWLIERAGHPRGLRDGNVGLSTRHALALVCHDGATAGEVVAFARRVRDAVQQRFGVTLVPEPNLWGAHDLG